MRRLPSGPPCFDPGHGHVVVARHRAVGDDAYVTAWLCPVRRVLCAILSDDSPARATPPGVGAGGPLEAL